MVTAKVNVNRSRGRIKGSSEEVKVLKELQKEMKNISGVLSNAQKLTQSGLMGNVGGAAAGAAGVLKHPLVAAAAAIIVGGAAFIKGQNELPLYLPDFAYEKGRLGEGGEDKIYKIDTMTGKILEELTMEEALARGIVDIKGRIVDYLESENSAWDIIHRGTEKVVDSTILSVDNYKELLLQEGNQIKLMQEINRLLELKAEQLADDVNAKTNVSLRPSKSTIFDEMESIMRRQENAPHQMVSRAPTDYSASERLLGQDAFRDMLEYKSAESPANKLFIDLIGGT